jgi:hypothetical protein
VAAGQGKLEKKEREEERRGKIFYESPNFSSHHRFFSPHLTLPLCPFYSP